MRVLRVEVDVDAHDARADRAGGFAHKRVGFPARRRGGGGRGNRRVSASGRVRFRFVFFRRRRRAAREALEVVEPRRGRAPCASPPSTRPRRRASPPRSWRWPREASTAASAPKPSSRTTRRAPPATAAAKSRSTPWRSWMARCPGRHADGNPSATHAERMRAWGRGGDDPRGVRRRECGRASHFFGSREKKCLYGCGEHAGSVASPRSARLGEEAPETLATRAPRCGPSRDGDASNPCVPLTQGVITVEPERENIWFCSLGIPKLVGERPFARKLEGAELLPEGMSRFPSRRVRGRPRARLAGLALALGLAMLVDDAPRERRRARGRAARRARLGTTREEACAGHCRMMPATPRRGQRGRGPRAHTDSSRRRSRDARNVPTRRTTDGARDGGT